MSDSIRQSSFFPAPTSSTPPAMTMRTSKTPTSMPPTFVGRPELITARAPSRRPGSKREQLLAAARAQFASSGFLGTHVSEVAATVGIRKSTFFHYFDDKESLYDASVEAVFADLALATDAIATANFDFATRIDLLTECIHQHACAEQAMPQLLLRALVDPPPPGVLRPSAIDRVITRLAEAVRLGVVEGRLRCIDENEIAPTLFAVMCMRAPREQPLLLPPQPSALLGVTPDMRLSEAKERVRRLLGVQ